MNKYYIGYPLSEDLTRIMAQLQHSVTSGAVLHELEQLHITAIYLGPMSREGAESIFTGIGRRTVPIIASLDTYKRFGEALVVTLQHNDALQEFHLELNRLAGRTPHKNGYTPHITIAKGLTAFIKIGCPDKAFVINSIALFEKQEGGQYHAHMVARFQ